MSTKTPHCVSILNNKNLTLCWHFGVVLVFCHTNQNKENKGMRLALWQSVLMNILLLSTKAIPVHPFPCTFPIAWLADEDFFMCCFVMWEGRLLRCPIHFLCEDLCISWITLMIQFQWGTRWEVRPHRQESLSNTNQVNTAQLFPTLLKVHKSRQN